MNRMNRSSLAPATAVLVGLLLAGCGGGDDAASGADDGATESGGAQEGAGDDGTRVVVDALGEEVTVPTDPQRVITLHYAATQPLFDLDLMPVGQGDYTDGIVPEDVLGELSEVPVVTDQGEPQLEDIDLLEPDLILAPNTVEEDTLEHLRATAPVYTFTLRGGDRANWEQRTEEVADAVNRSEARDELAGDFEARQEEIARTYADQIDGTSVAVIGAFEENNLYVWGEENMTGSILMPLGFTWSAQSNELVAGEDEAEITVSFEKVNAAVGDADLLLLDSNLRGELNPFMTDLMDTPLFQQLPAVQAGHAYPAGKNTIAGYSDANYNLDRVEEILAELGER